MPSVLWAGDRGKGPVRMTLGVWLTNGLRYELVCGLPDPNQSTSSFKLDPVIKEETVSFRSGRTTTVLLDRGKSGATIRDSDGVRIGFPMTLSTSESALVQISEPHRFPHMAGLRDSLSRWRFYHGFRTDAAAPIRQPQVGVFTPILADDGRDLAAALQTVIDIGDADGLFRAVRRGLDGAMLHIKQPDGTALFSVQLETPGLRRPLEAAEMSDGTLRYLCLLAALLSPRPPSVLALNEPETSLHPDLLPALAALIAEAAEKSQLWITTHSEILAREIAQRTGVAPIQLVRLEGETRVA